MELTEKFEEQWSALEYAAASIRLTTGIIRWTTPEQFWPSGGKAASLISVHPSPQPLSVRAIGVLLMALFLPVALAILVFPTPMYDTRELIAWGRHFPLVTPVHPPMMVWIGGAADRLFGPSAAVMIFANQILMVIGLCYFYATLRLMTIASTAAFFTFLYATSFYTVFAPLSFALNADVLQMVSWPAVVFYALRASRSRQLSHWMAFGAWSAAAILTKYNAAVLFAAMAVAALFLPTFRKTLKDPGFYLAIAAAVVLVLPHTIAVMRHPDALSYGLAHFGDSFENRLQSLRELGLGHLIAFMPGLLIVPIGLWTGILTIRPLSERDADGHRFLLIVNATMQILLLGLVLIVGLDYVFRFSAPYVMMAVLALAPFVTWTDRADAWFERRVVPSIGWTYGAVGLVLVALYTGFASHSGLQEPTADGAVAVLADWHKTYPCGPAYIFGGRQGVYGVGIEAPRDVTALDYREAIAASWFDRTLLTSRGAIVIDGGPEFEARMAKFLPGIVALDEKQITLPLRRTYKPKSVTYFYHFVAPQGCGS